MELWRINATIAVEWIVKQFEKAVWIHITYAY